MARTTHREDHTNVTETAAPIFPTGRYGKRREPRRSRRVLIAVLLIPVVLAGLWLAVRLYRQYGGTDYQSTLQSTSIINDHQVKVNFAVHKPGGLPAICQVQAQDFSMAEVGYATVSVPAGVDVRVNYLLSTTARAYGVNVLGCQPG
jgi:hypothetical protein